MIFSEIAGATRILTDLAAAVNTFLRLVTALLKERRILVLTYLSRYFIIQTMDTFLALAEPNRRKIMEMLAADGNLSATDIYKRFKSTPPAVSQHLKVLRDANLVRVEKRAQQRIYYLNPEPMKELEKWIRHFTVRTDERYQALDKVLEKMKSEPIA